MSDDPLHPLFHPPLDPDPPRDAALTAAVMTRVRALPTPAGRRRARHAVWALAAMIAAVAVAPIDSIALLGDAFASVGAPALDPGTMLETALMAAIVVALAALAARRRHVR